MVFHTSAMCLRSLFARPCSSSSAERLWADLAAGAAASGSLLPGCPAPGPDDVAGSAASAFSAAPGNWPDACCCPAAPAAIGCIAALRSAVAAEAIIASAAALRCVWEGARVSEADSACAGTALLRGTCCTGPGAAICACAAVAAAAAGSPVAAEGAEVVGAAPAHTAARSILRACRADLAAEEAAAAGPWLCASGSAPSCSSANAAGSPVAAEGAEVMGPAPAQIAARSILRACRADLAAEEAAAAVPWLCASGAAPSCSSENAERCTAMVVPTGNTSKLFKDKQAHHAA